MNWATFSSAALGGACVGLFAVDCILYAVAHSHGIDTGPLRYIIVCDAAIAAVCFRACFRATTTKIKPL